MSADQYVACTRRQWIRHAALGLAATVIGKIGHAEDSLPAGQGLSLSIGTYSLTGLRLEEAIDLVAEIGYDGIELAAQPGFDGEPALLPLSRRREVRQRLADRGLKLTALMEQLYPAADDARHQADIGRLRRVLALSRELAPADPPLIQTVLGGGTWEEKKTLFRDRLGDWLAAAQEAKVTLSIKPHRGGAMSRPSEAIWLIEQLGNSHRLRMVYDYSHYAFRDMPLEETVRTSLPFATHVAVKDAVQKDGRVVFVLPGESGTFDYAKLLRLFYDGGYRGDICCEVSSMVFSQGGYDPAAAARTCYNHLARAFTKAEIPRAG